MTCRKVTNASNSLAIVPATANVPVRKNTALPAKHSPRAPLRIVPAKPAPVSLATAPRASLGPVLASIQDLEAGAEEYQQWCDATVSSLTWIREAIEGRDMGALEEALSTLETGVDVSAPVLARMGELARVLRKALTKTS
jgi:hypothetical protein